MKRQHVVVLPSLGLGHLIPLLEFSKRLVLHHDLQISFLIITTTTDNSSSSAANGQLLQPSNLPPDLHLVQLPPVDVDKVTNSEMQILTRVCTITEEGLRSLKSVLMDIGIPKALIVDLFCTQAFEVCRELSIPAYSLITTSVSFFAFSLYFVELDRTVEGDLADLPEPIQVPGCGPVRIEDLLDQARIRNSDEYKWFLFHTSRWRLADGLFLNSWEDFEPVTLQAIRENPFFKSVTPSIYPIGPVIKQEEPDESAAEYMSWLDKQPPDSVVFVALGSGGTLSGEQIIELAWGLELSRQRFIWVVRKPTEASSSGTFFNVGSDTNSPEEYLPAGFLEKTQGVGVVVPSWAPQVPVLHHPSTGGFITHCGWNSTLETIVHGVPMIAWPLYAEQKMNATVLAEDIGVAIKPKVKTGQTVVGREQIARVVRMVIEGDEGNTIRRRVRELKETATKALDAGGSSHESVCRVVEEWKALS
ncbi:hypothetical protein SLEP1_g16908 [Rubroshorea leprosula]|uniref:Glycosyltransferase n=1 Tax=Rubroshorea leprosula TaxID=152421 RepID=A0AAV5J1L3_9ROSI|nr:hypothetical protein SLEP1_g16908 [Rubroshorea leprosula]